MNRDDLEAILEDIEDICARIPEKENIEFKPTLRYSSSSAISGETFIAFDCRHGKYVLTVVRQGIAKTTRFINRQSLLDRLYPEEEQISGEEENVEAPGLSSGESSDEEEGGPLGGLL